jgi:hypothetical protein
MGFNSVFKGLNQEIFYFHLSEWFKIKKNNIVICLIKFTWRGQNVAYIFGYKKDKIPLKYELCFFYSLHLQNSKYLDRHIY